MVSAGLLLKALVVAGEKMGEYSKVRAPETLDQVHELLTLVKGLNRTFEGEHAHIEALVGAQLVSIR